MSLLASEARSRETSGRQAELCRYFFSEFFESEFVASPGQMKAVFAGIVSILISLPLPFAQAYYHKYRLLNALADSQPFENARLADFLFLVSGTMLVAALATVFQWPALFPTRRDYLALAALPIRASQIFLGKAAALLAFMLAVILPLALFASGLPGLMSGDHSGPTGIQAIALFLSSVAAGLFTFLALVTLQGLILNLSPARFYDGSSLALRATLLLLLCAATPAVLSIGGLTAHMAERPAWIGYPPPLWFLGLTQVLSGRPDPIAIRLAHTAWIALLCTLFAALACYLWSYHHHRLRVLESDRGPARMRRSLWSGVLDGWIQSPRTRGLFSFIAKTLARSAQHRLILTAFLGIALAVIVESFAWLGLSSAASLRYGRQVAVAVPLLLSLFTLAGFRFLFRLPAELRANWIFRLHEPGHAPELRAATERFLLAAAVLPVTCLSLPIEVYLLGWKPGIAATFLAMFPALPLAEAILFSFDRIPFTSAYFPGQAPVAQTLLSYLIATVLYAGLPSALVVLSLDQPAVGAFYVTAIAVLWWRIRSVRHSTQRALRLDFEEKPEPIVHVLAIERD